MDATDIDLSLLDEVCAGDQSIRQTMINMFIANTPGSLSKLDEAVKAREFDAIYKAAHFMKSSLSVIKVTPMFDTVVTICAKARQQQDYDDIVTLTNNLHQFFNSSIPYLTN